jgi:hypothetical protein
MKEITQLSFLISFISQSNRLMSSYHLYIVDS